MRRIALIPAALAALAVLALGACGGEEEPTGPARSPFVLRIESTSSPDRVKLDGVVGRSATAPGGDAPQVSIEDISGEQVTISTSEEMAPEGDGGGVDLDDLRSTFTVARDQPVRFSTPTTDSGTTYTVTYEVLSVE